MSISDYDTVAGEILDLLGDELDGVDEQVRSLNKKEKDKLIDKIGDLIYTSFPNKDE